MRPLYIWMLQMAIYKCCHLVKIYRQRLLTETYPWFM